MRIIKSASGSSAWRGLDYYKNKKVVNYKKINENEYEGEVLGSGNKKYKILLNIEHPRNSKCNCPHASSKKIVCKHMVALYFMIFPKEAKKFEDDAEKAMKYLIEHTFGEFSVESIKVIGAGLDSVAYLVNDEYIFKKSKHKEAAENMKKEISVLRYLEGKLPLEIPRIEFYDADVNICGYKEIKGTILTPEMYSSMNNEEQKQLAKDIANFLIQLHALPLPEIDDLELDVIEDYKNDYEALKSMIYDKIPSQSKEYLDKLFSRILTDEKITKYSVALCHNDLSCNHIIMRNKKVIGIIDFGDVAITDRDKDFVYLLEDSDEEIGREFGLKVLNYYNHPNKEIAILKADLNDEYYPIEEILGGTSKELELMYNEGLSKIRNI